LRPVVGYVLIAGDRFGENCLSVNVWTPAVDDGRRPVMVWLHGGSQTAGSANIPIYDGANLARSGDTVVVSVNHRLGMLGYLSLTEIAGEDYSTAGNAGLLDMIAALQWVRNNITAFGGDPYNVTIFGQSGGGPKVAALLAAPAAEGFFHKAFIQSGPGLRALDPAAAAATAAAIVQRLGTTAAVEALLDASVQELLAAQVDVLGGALPTGRQHRLGPVVDGDVLPGHPFDPIAAPSAANVPLLIGTTRDEMTLFLHDNPMLADLDDTAAAELAPSVAQGITDLYPTYRQSRPDATPAELLTAIATDVRRIGSIRVAEHKLAAGNSPVWIYRCDLPSPALDGTLGATHGVDLPLVFNNLPVPPPPQPSPPR
jgi:para-nitrobenzyl esterase